MGPSSTDASGTAHYADYERVRMLGRGAHGRVILLRSPADGSLLVAKEIPLYDMDASTLRAVQNEVRILASLSHPSIISYHGSYRAAEALAIVMEFADRGNLAEAISMQAALAQPFATPLVVRWAGQLARALAHLHSMKVLHRDLKSANVLLCSTPRGADDELDVKLADFGISRAMSTNTRLAETVCGTPFYMSPELIRGEPYAEPADAWALGVVLFELLALRRPFDGTNIGMLVVAISSGQYDAAALAAASHPPELKHVASDQGLLHKDPAARMSVDRLCECVHALQAARDGGAQAEATPAHGHEPKGTHDDCNVQA